MAMAALRLSTGPGQGMVMAPSAMAEIGWGTPLPSLPIRRATGPMRSMRWAGSAHHGRGGKDAQARFSQAGDGVDGAGGQYWKAENASGGCSDCFGVPGADGTGEGEDAGGAEGLSGAEDGAEVAGVLNSGKDQNQRGGVLRVAEKVGPGPLGAAFDGKGGDGLGGFSGEGGVEEFAGQQNNFGLRGKGEGIEKALGTLGDEDAIDDKTGAQGLGKQVGALNAGQMRRTAAARLPCWVGQRLAELLEARVLLTLYNAKRHDSGNRYTSMPILSRLDAGARVR